MRGDRARVEAEGFWIYNDLPKGLAEAERTGKPLVVALRCIPCEECVKLDDELVDKDTRVRPLLEKFVRVRVISTNGLDLSTFQFDTDQSFTVFLLRADGTIYGRFGTRSDRTEWADDVSIEGLAKALEGALELHEGPPAATGRAREEEGTGAPVPDARAVPVAQGEVRREARRGRQGRAELHPLPPDRRGGAHVPPGKARPAPGGGALPLPAPEDPGPRPRPEGARARAARRGRIPGRGGPASGRGRRARARRAAAALDRRRAVGAPPHAADGRALSRRSSSRGVRWRGSRSASARTGAARTTSRGGRRPGGSGVRRSAG